MAGYAFSREPHNVEPVTTDYRKIATPIPAPGTADLLARLDVAESRSMHGELPIAWNRAENFSVYDSAGNRWIDFTSAIFVTNVGHANPRLANALKQALDDQLVHSYAYATEVRARYIERLIKFVPGELDKAFLVSTGTEATETALKLMRLAGSQRGKRRLGVLCIEGSFHGQTYAAQLMSGRTNPAWVRGDNLEIFRLPFPYPWALRNCSGAEFFAESVSNLKQNGIDPTRDLAGFLLETFQGWGAVFYPPDYVSAVAAFCTNNSIVFGFDEMQAGFARTGRRFGFEHYGVDPDLICCGKGMGSGYPLAGVIGRAALLDLPEVGAMSSTHSANPLACVAGLATIDEIETRDLVRGALDKGQTLLRALNELQKRHPDHIEWCFGKGLVAAILFRGTCNGASASEFTSRVVERCMQKGVLVVHTGRESIKLGPPLTIPEDALLEGVAVLDEAIGDVAARHA